MEEKSLSLKELFLLGYDYFKEIWSKKWWVVASALVFAILLVIHAYTRPTKYFGEVTFMVSEEDGGGAGVAAILGSFGLGGGGQTNYDKIIAVAISDRILKEVLFDSMTIGVKKDLVANHIIRLENLHEKWNDMKDTNIHNFYFTSNPISSIYPSNKINNLVTKILIRTLKGDPSSSKNESLVKLKADDKTGILKISVISGSEEFSAKLANLYYDKVSSFYINKTVARQRATKDNLQAKADSVYRLMYQAEGAAASFSDQSMGMVLNTNRLPLARNTRKVEMYGMIYAQILENLEKASFVLESQTPYFQLIDRPLLPLNTTTKKIPLKIFIGLIFGIFISSSFIVIRLLFKNIMSE